jgi:hypothetical protein
MFLGAAVLLAACGSKSASNEAKVANNVPASSTPTSAPTVETNSDETEAGNSPALLPPANAALRFVGAWATSYANCASASWRFTADELTRPDGSHCSIYKVNKVPGGYDLAAQCPAKKPISTDLIKLRFAESAGAMLVESNAIKPTGLVYCGK